ncbi:MAG: helix-turn-helix domain-containing protein [Gammaproteobacteria bacterium]|nr:MAG: helix-turn-helix domain-containing protein [Gammaproteobacteria bacterium]
MTDQQDSDQKDSNKKAIKLGARLREAREASRWSVAEAAERLNLEPSVIDALESDQYEKLPERTFIRGYLGAYIRLLGLPGSLLKDFDANDQVKEYVPLSSASTYKYKSSCSRDGWVKCINTGLVVLLIAAAVIWLVEKEYHLFTPEQESQTQEVSSAEPAIANDQQQPQALEPDDEVNPLADFTPEEDSEPDAVSEGVDETTETEGPVLTQEQDAPATAMTDEEQADQQQESASTDDLLPNEHTLFLRFSDASWIQVKDADNKILVNTTYRGGDEKLLRGPPPFKFVVGRIRNIAIDYNGEPVDVTQYYDQKVARFSIGDNAEDDGG